MSENNANNKKNKELEPGNKERNLQEYNSNDKDINTENNNKLDQRNNNKPANHNHDDNCSCGV